MSLPGPLALLPSFFCVHGAAVLVAPAEVASTSLCCRAILHDRSWAIYGAAQMLCQRAGAQGTGGGLVGDFLNREHNCQDTG